MVMESITATLDAGYDIAQAAADCALPGLSEASCASDLTSMMTNWMSLGSNICTATLVCGDVDNVCAATVTNAVAHVSSVANALIASASDCISDPFICVYDVITAIDGMNGLVADFMAALEICNERGHLPSPLEEDFFLENQFGGVTTIDDRRRLSATGAMAGAAAPPRRPEEGPHSIRHRLDDLVDKLRLRAQDSELLSHRREAAQLRSADSAGARADARDLGTADLTATASSAGILVL
eukprot:CAMPEP_0176253698 /NCGR_PEP_ID=MMETSP0121_2-20121125/36151_1 /TAXON_ID=160619 /ORGANISM="Kryptoperidinium foliaceum, Strain CCMP 1326" /LENGTH=239 /DNA_ID=CAMNT_0017593485 /DNA_START=55 /DNA_END=774 /DNA_ORIENTATION=+